MADSGSGSDWYVRTAHIEVKEGPTPTRVAGRSTLRFALSVSCRTYPSFLAVCPCMSPRSRSLAQSIARSDPDYLRFSIAARLKSVIRVQPVSSIRMFGWTRRKIRSLGFISVVYSLETTVREDEVKIFNNIE